jgi:hypothetical protein
METKKMILGVYDNPDKTYAATKKLLNSGYSVEDVYSPFAIHGIDRLMGIKRSKLSVAAFLFAMTGLSLAVPSLCFILRLANDYWGKTKSSYPNLHSYYFRIKYFVYCIWNGIMFLYCK